MPLRSLRLAAMASSSLHAHLCSSRTSILPSNPLLLRIRGITSSSQSVNLDSPPRLLPLVASIAQLDHADKPLVAASSGGGFRRPEAIEYQKELVNQVNLIGTVGRSVELKQLDGKTKATCGLKVTRYSQKGDLPDMWFWLEFWNELAEIAATHLKMNERIFVSGSVSVESYTGKDNLQKTICKIKAKDLKYVSSVDQNFGVKADPKESWTEYFDNPSEWWDNRLNKINPKSPDFKNKRTGAALWIDGFSTPAWVKTQLEGHDSMKPSFVDDETLQGEKSYFKNNADLESSWKAYFANPSEWWDNRKEKKNPKSPDFKHKVSGAALWIDGYSTPPWVKARFAGHDAQEPSHVKVAGEATNVKNGAPLESAWKTFIANPSEWWDNRDTKKSPRYPDFKHKTTGEALWINSCPDWVKSQLTALDFKSPATGEEEMKAGGLSSSSKELDNNRLILEEELQFF